MDDVIFDLFGNPSRPGKGQRGRPPFEATQKDRNKVKLLLALGWGNQRIANALAISLATLKRYFRSELKEREMMRDRLEARRIEQAWELADTGNAGGMRQLDRLIEKNDLAGLDRRMRAAQNSDDGEADEDTSARRMGKKEAAKEAAKTAGEGSDWGSDLLPGVMN